MAKMWYPNVHLKQRSRNMLFMIFWNSPVNNDVVCAVGEVVYHYQSTLTSVLDGLMHARTLYTY